MKGTKRLAFFERYLTIWVLVCIGLGVLLGRYIPQVPAFLSKLEYAHVSIPVAILIWLMIYPMMLKVDFSSIKRAALKPKGLVVTSITNWLIKPFTMYLIAWFFFFVVFKAWLPEGIAREYLAGAVLLGAAPCTAMVFVWSYLADGDPAYTLVQVAVNDLIIPFAFAPIVMLLLGISHISVPYDTLLLSVVLFVVIPFGAAALTRSRIIAKRGAAYLTDRVLPRFKSVTVIGLLLTLVLLFAFQGEGILKNPGHILLVAVPLIIQTFFIFTIAYLGGYLWRLPHDIAAPGAMIGASNFFELSVAVAISLFGLQSGAAFATVVGVLVEVPVMLALVGISKKTRHWFEERRRTTA